MEELKKEIEESGVSNIEAFFKKRLDRWREVEVNIAILVTLELANLVSSTQYESEYNI